MTTIIKNYEDTIEALTRRIDELKRRLENPGLGTIDRECLESRIRVLSDERREVIADLAEIRNRG